MTIFVFGSNIQGIHGKGSALTARWTHGAELGVGEGRTGDAYAIPTRSKQKGQFVTLDLVTIAFAVERFKKYARANPELQFDIVAVGTGSAGYSHEDMAQLFRGAPANCRFLENKWRVILARE